ncbi:type II toxin-antitoxin system RelE family toxin [Candidatus Poriferisodalis sp.]|uniref:type II toxin-antitoxin system RelE family toxin n=1 Tax=Candidatus Poriferisodalis sp. TaxID=3101277 RepID=UPI003B0269E5
MEIIRRLDNDPALGKKLQGRLSGFRSARLGRSHRIIYRVSSDVIRVTAITPRKDAYR